MSVVYRSSIGNVSPKNEEFCYVVEKGLNGHPFSTKDGYNENWPDIPYIGHEPASWGEVEESARHEWVNHICRDCILYVNNII